MHKKSVFKVIIAIAVAMAFVMPVAAFANFGTIEVTFNSENNGDMEIMVESTNSDTIDNTKTASDDEKPFIEPIEDTVIDTETLSVVNDADSIVSAGKIWYVGSGAGNDSATIQGGVNLADPAGGDTVYVYSGTYNEKVTVDKRLDLIGESKNVIVDGGGSGNVVTVTVNDVNISTFTITKGTYGIYITGSSSNIMNCKVYNNAGSGKRYGIYLDGSSGNKITNCEVHENKGSTYGYGIYLKSSSGNTIMNCDVYSNNGGGSGQGNGIYLDGSSGNTVINCKLHHNDVPKTNAYGIQSKGSSNNNKIINCEIYNNGCFGIRFEAGASSTFIENCYVHDNNNGVYPVTLGTGIMLVDSPNSKILNSTLSYQATGIVISSWTPSYTTIDNCTIYKNTGSGNSGIETTTYASDNTITNCDIYGNGNSGGLSISSSSNIIAYCNVHDNVGSGIELWHRESSGNIVTNCDVYNNSESGIYLRGRSQTITNCNIYNNNEDGIYSDCYKPYETSDNIITHCNVYDNNNYGIYFEEVSNCDIISCNVHDNGYGIYLQSSIDCTLDENTIYDNAGNFGVDGTDIGHFHHDIDQMNTINTKPIYYIVERENVTLDGILNIGYLAMISCTNMTMKNLDIPGTMVINTTDSTILDTSSYNGVHGIYLWISSNCNITRCDAYNNAGNGIYLLDSSNITITNCNAYDNANIGIYLEDSSNIKLSGNTLYDNVYNFDVSGTTLDHYIHDIYTPTSLSNENTVDGKLIYYLVQQNNLTLDETDNIGYLALVSCTNITAKNLDVTNVLAINTPDSTFLNISAHDSVTNGIYLWMSPDCTIMNCEVYNNIKYGIYASSSPGTTIENCNTYDNFYGIYLLSSPYSVITNCTTDNTDPPISTYQNRGIYLVSSDNSSVVNCDISNGRYGISLYKISNCNVIGCTVYDTHFGIMASTEVHNNVIMDCDISRSQFQSIQIQGSSSIRATKNAIINCNMYDNTGVTFTLYLKYADYTSITNCKIRNSPTYGIYFEYSQYSTITGCTIRNNVKHGIYLKSTSNNNEIYHNNFIGNNPNAYDLCTNTWDDGYPSGGNYWSDYTGADGNGDGIGDTPYSITGKTPPNQDRYPLMVPWNDTTPPEIKNVVLTTSDPMDTIIGWEKVTCTVTDLRVNEVKLVVTDPDGITTEYTMTQSGPTYERSCLYTTTFTIAGDYTYYIWANDKNETPNEATSTPKAFALPPNHDVDMDRTTGFWDLIKVVKYYGETGTPGWIRADVDNDGKAGFWDLIEVVKYYGEIW